MQILLKFSFFFVIVLMFSPVESAECPEGTRNNYKGECVPVALLNEDTQTQQEEAQKWLEPVTDSGVVEEVAPEGNVETAAGESSEELVVIVEEVGAADEDEPSTLASEEPLPDSPTTTDLANALLTIQQLREEIQDLLNRVELQRYEVEKLRGRQRDLYDDLDQRLRKQERLVLTVPVPATPSVDSIVISAEAVPFAEPTPMVAGDEQPSLSAESSTQGATEVVVVTEAQDGEIPVIAATTETVVAVPAPTPKVVGTDLPVPSANSGAEVVVQPQPQGDAQDGEISVIAATTETVVAVPEPTPMVPSTDTGAVVIVQPQIQIETSEREPPTEFVAVKQMDDRSVAQVTTVVVEASGTEISESTIQIEIPKALDLQDNQPNAGDEMTSVAAADVSTESQATVVTTATVPTIVTLSEQDAYDHAFNMLKQSRYEEAAEEFANFLRQHQNSQLTDDAWYWMAEAHYVIRDFERALIGFNTVISYFVNSPRIPASRLKIGYIQYEMGDYDGSRETLAQLLRDFPAHRVAVSAEARLKKIDRERQ